MASPRAVRLARTLRAARALSGKEVREIALDVGLSERAYYRLESGGRLPNALELEDIARATGQAIGFFFPPASLAAEDGTGTVTPSPRQVKASAPSQQAAGRALRRRIVKGAPR